MDDYDHIRNQNNHRRHICRYLLNVPNVWQYCAVLVYEIQISDACMKYFYSDDDNRDDIVLPQHMQAFYYGRLSVARMLLNLKADMEATDIYGLTACHLAIDANQEKLLKFALENGANVEARDACGWTLLMRSVVMNADFSILQLLITYGANVKVQDTLGLTCLDLARLYGYNEYRKYFENLFLKEKEEKKEQEEQEDKDEKEQEQEFKMEEKDTKKNENLI
uniref:ANK_REP_REGION domain-containing protein n=1 Tax=Glossina brevipalpis TaxID=37001 RepID=A0A1A9WGE8_9MUSC